MKQVWRTFFSFCYSIHENEQIDVLFTPAVMKLWFFLCPYLNTWEMRNCTSFATASCGFWMDALYYKCFPLSWLLFRRESSIRNSGWSAHKLSSLEESNTGSALWLWRAVWWGLWGSTPWESCWGDQEHCSAVSVPSTPAASSLLGGDVLLNAEVGWRFLFSFVLAETQVPCWTPCNFFLFF